MDKQANLAVLKENVDASLAAARLGLDSPVSACSGWNVGSLMGHLGTVFTHWNARVSRRHTPDPDPGPADFASLPGFEAWHDADFSPDTMPDGVVEWMEQRAADLQATLAVVSPGEHVATWFEPDQTAGFVQRRMAQETTIHRWDAQSAQGEPDPIEPEVARDGIDEMMDVHVQARREWEEPRASAGERYHFHATDGPGEWFVQFLPDRVEVRREHARGDIAIRGTASDLLLFLWGRIPAERLDIAGDASLAARWFELVPPD